MKIYTKHKRPDRKYPEMKGEKKVDTKGALTNEQQVMRVMQAGVDLVNFRREFYDFGNADDINDSVAIPERASDFGIADASTILRNAEPEIKKLEDAIKKAESKKKKEPLEKELEELRKKVKKAEDSQGTNKSAEEPQE